MTDGQDDEKWHHRLGGRIATVLRNLFGKRGILGIIFLGAFVATVVGAWHFPDSRFGKFSLPFGIPITSVGVGLWGADYYYRKDAYRKRYRDVEVSVYTILLLMVGVETIKNHILTATNGLSGWKPNENDIDHKLTAHSEIRAGQTAADLTIKMAYLALTNLSNFSTEAVKAGKEKFATDEYEADVRQQVYDGKRPSTPGASATSTKENGGTGNG